MTVNKCQQSFIHTKFNIFSLLNSHNTTNNFSKTSTKNQDLVFAFSESKVSFYSQQDDDSDFLYPNNKECFYTNSLLNYLNMMKGKSFNTMSLSQLKVLLI
jgi:hypothetical protein